MSDKTKTVSMTIKVPKAVHDKMKFVIGRKTGKTLEKQANEALEEYVK